MTSLCTLHEVQCLRRPCEPFGIFIEPCVLLLLQSPVPLQLQWIQGFAGLCSLPWPQSGSGVEDVKFFFFSLCQNSPGVMNAFPPPSWISPNRSHLSDWISVPSFYILQLISTPWWEAAHWWRKQLDKICINKCSSFNIICAAALLIIHNYPVQAGRGKENPSLISWPLRRNSVLGRIKQRWAVHGHPSYSFPCHAILLTWGLATVSRFQHSHRHTETTVLWDFEKTQLLISECSIGKPSQWLWASWGLGFFFSFKFLWRRLPTIDNEYYWGQKFVLINSDAM